MYFKGYASVFDVVDKHKDIIKKGAFIDAVNNFKSKPITLLLQHDFKQEVGEISILKEDDYGLYVEGFINENFSKSNDLISDINTGLVSHLSIGYYNKGLNKKEEGITYIDNVELVEISFVKWAANELAKIILIK